MNVLYTITGRARVPGGNAEGANRAAELNIETLSPTAILEALRDVSVTAKVEEEPRLWRLVDYDGTGLMQIQRNDHFADWMSDQDAFNLCVAEFFGASTGAAAAALRAHARDAYAIIQHRRLNGSAR